MRFAMYRLVKFSDGTGVLYFTRYSEAIDSDEAFNQTRGANLDAYLPIGEYGVARAALYTWRPDIVPVSMSTLEMVGYFTESPHPFWKHQRKKQARKV